MASPGAVEVALRPRQWDTTLEGLKRRTDDERRLFLNGHVGREIGQVFFAPPNGLVPDQKRT
jgi:hypothetical protein